MGGYNTKNYQKLGGSDWIIGGNLTVSAAGNLQLTDTVTGTVYNVSVASGVLTLTEA